MRNSAYLAFLVVFTVLLQGCGFHLRGVASVPDTMKVVSVQGISPDSPLGAELASVLRGSDIKVVDSPAEAQAILRVTNLRNDRRVLSVSGGTGRVREYEIVVSVNMTVTDNKGKVIIPLQQLSQVRDYTFDETGVLGKETEEIVLRQEMRRELIQQILRRMSVNAG